MAKENITWTHKGVKKTVSDAGKVLKEEKIKFGFEKVTHPVTGTTVKIKVVDHDTPSKKASKEDE